MRCRRSRWHALEYCPDHEWRLLFALSRFGGLRCPSEHVGLRWGDIQWSENRMVVTSPKTEHYAGGESRVVPLFPELRPHLEEAFERATPGAEFVLTKCRDIDKNLRTHLLRIIRKVGLSPWPKLFQNLRSTRETELAEDFPLHVVCAWIGNS
ncbi:tyrosine-type recombinase/integrase [bacterium]|nr:tyrosine-type recombinase/integrase [bacterium]